MRSSYTIICAVLVLLLAAQAQLSVLAVTCNPVELSPCLPALTGPSEPTKPCCVKVNEEKPCLCQYAKNPMFKKYFDSPNAQKISTACKIPFPKC